ncbi:MAG: gluconate 2-dehydrogenase subunit 3 family protein [Bacteroidota bacterium]
MDRRKALRHTGLLVGAGVGLPSLLTLLNSCQAEPRLTWEPQFFSEEDAKCISALVDTILPRTETPGALDVNVDVFLDRVIAQTFDEEGQNNWRNDLATFHTTCREAYGDVFANLDSDDRTKVLKAEEQKAGKFSYGVWGKTVGDQAPVGFYKSVKSMAIWAYCSSEKIGMEVLSYDPIPGEYKGCISVDEVGNRWSL